MTAPFWLVIIILSTQGPSDSPAIATIPMPDERACKDAKIALPLGYDIGLIVASECIPGEGF